MEKKQMMEPLTCRMTIRREARRSAAALTAFNLFSQSGRIWSAPISLISLRCHSPIVTTSLALLLTLFLLTLSCCLGAIPGPTPNSDSDPRDNAEKADVPASGDVLRAECRSAAIGSSGLSYITPKSVSTQNGQQAASDSRWVTVASVRLIWTKHSVQTGC